MEVSMTRQPTSEPAPSPSRGEVLAAGVVPVDPSETLTVIYNGACPICRREIDHYRRQAGNDLNWLDATAGSLPVPGLEPDEVFRRLHVMDGDGRTRAGVDAFIALWGRLPRYRWLARTFASPPIRGIASVVYDRLIAPPLYAWHRRRVARADRREAVGR